MSRLIGGLIRFLVIVFLTVAAVGILAPLALNGPIAKEINKHFEGKLTIASANLSVWPPRLQVNDVKLLNPKTYPAGDMIAIGRVDMDIDITNSQTVLIDKIVFSEVSGYPSFIDNVDAYGVYQEAWIADKKKIPTGIWRWPVVVQSVQIRNAWAGNNEPMLKLDDRNYDPIGRLQNPVSLHDAVIDSLDHVISQQRKAVPQLMIENVKGRVKGALDAVGKKLEEWSR